MCIDHHCSPAKGRARHWCEAYCASRAPDHETPCNSILLQGLRRLKGEPQLEPYIQASMADMVVRCFKCFNIAGSDGRVIRLFILWSAAVLAVVQDCCRRMLRRMDIMMFIQWSYGRHVVTGCVCGTVVAVDLHRFSSTGPVYHRFSLLRCQKDWNGYREPKPSQLTLRPQMHTLNFP